MKMIAAVTSCPTGIAHTVMAAEALKKAAELLGHQIKVEMQGSAGTKNPLSEEDIAAADVILLATDIRVDTRRFLEKPIYETYSSEAILKPKAVIQAALALLPAETLPVSTPPATTDATATGLGCTPWPCLSRKATRRDHVMPDWHRAHFHGRRSVAESGESARAFDQG